ITDTHSLSPARMGHAGFGRDIGKSPVAIVFEEMRSGFLTGWKALKARAVHQKNVQPAVVVVIVESDAATRGLEQVFILMLAAVDGLCVQSRFARNVDETQPQAGARFRWLVSGREKSTGLEGTRQCQDTIERQ